MAEVSIIVPIFNIPEKFFLECVDSICAQTVKDIEIILVDDGNKGKNNLPGICDEYSKKDTRIKVIHQQNKGVSASRNAGIRMAESEYIMFVDADDWIDKDTVKTIIQLCTDDTDVILWEYKTFLQEKPIEEELRCKLGSGVISKYADKKEIEMLQRAVICSRAQTKEGMNGSPVCKLYKKEILYSNNIYFDETLPRSQDNEFNFRYFEFVNKAIYIEKKLYFYRRFSESATNKYRPDARMAIENYLNIVYQDLNRFHKSPIFYEDYSYIVFNKFIDICKTDYAHPANEISMKDRCLKISDMAVGKRFRKAFSEVRQQELSKFEKQCYLLVKRKQFRLLTALFLIRYIVLMRKVQ